MYWNYKLSHRLIAYVLLASLSLQSCSNRFHPIPTRERYLSTGSRESLRENMQESMDDVDSGGLLVPTRARKSECKEVTPSHLLAIPLLSTFKRGKASTRNITNLCRLSVRSKNLIGLNGKVPLVSACHISSHPIFTTYPDSTTSQWDIVEEKEVETMSYHRPLFRSTKEASTRSHNYSNPSYLGSKSNWGPLVFSRSYHRPNDGIHLHYAAQSYEDDGGKGLQGKESEWNVVDILREKNGYFGSAYCDPKNKHIIIAHRGTEGMNLKDWRANFDTILRNLNPQQSSACKFSETIIKGHGPAYNYSFTGHSLGGWLALTTLYKYKDIFINKEAGNYQDAFAVTFDNPGGRELLEALQPRDDDYSIDINRLDITSYVSCPNQVNTAMRHVGSKYALLPELKEFNWFERNTGIFTLRTHEKKLFLDSFSLDSGLPKQCVRVIDWPWVQWGTPIASSADTNGLFDYLLVLFNKWINGEIQAGEYKGFYRYQYDAVRNPDQLSSADQFQLQHGIHYRAEAFDEKKLPLRNMPELVRRFLVDLSEHDMAYRNAIIKFVGETIDPELAELLEKYHIDKHQDIVVDQNATHLSAHAFRNKIIEYLKRHPILYQKKVSAIYMESILKRVERLEAGTVDSILTDLDNQLRSTKDLIEKLSFKQGTARLYRFTKPSREEIEEIRSERNALDKQLMALELTNRKIQGISLEIENESKIQLIDRLKREQEQLKIAKQGVDAWLKYLEGELTEADKQFDLLIANLGDNAFNLLDLKKDLLLNRAYNFKAKIAARLDSLGLSMKYYERAIELLPEDKITLNNYGGLLTDYGYLKKDVKLLTKAYHCYERIYPYFTQMSQTQLPIICSGMAYNFILLAQSIEKGESVAAEQDNLTKVPELRTRALGLLERAIQENPTYLNARLFLAILFHDQGKYEAAFQEINNALSIQSTHEQSLMYQGLIMSKLGKTNEAIAVLKQAHQYLLIRGKNAPWITKFEETIKEIEEEKNRLGFVREF